LWNRDGLFTQGTAGTNTFDGDFTTADTITPAGLAAYFTIDTTTKAWSQRTNSSGNNLLFVKDIARSVDASGNAIPAQSYRSFGLAAIDRTEGGLVFHATIDKATYTYTNRESPYGFAFNDGIDLPGPLTVATDQALYSQGDWNIADKRPASHLADTITVLSNSCLATANSAASGTDPAYRDGQINCGKLAGQDVATPTTVNAAYLSRTDVSTNTPQYYSGGLNNYMRMLENWNGISYRYRGSFVSLGAPQEMSGAYVAGSTDPGAYYIPPNRDWAYDTFFDTFANLPPLSPRVINIRQNVFQRNYGTFN
jgi:hypothetical protein